MNIDTNDPRLTAYALGELEGPDRDAVEAALAGDDEARRHVEEVREVARLLGESFRQEQEHEQAPALTADQRVAIEATLVETPAGQPTGTGAPPVAGSLPTHKQWHNTLALFVLAACLLFGSAILLIPAKNSGRMTGTLAMRDPSPAGSYADDRFGRPATVRERTSGNVFAPSNTPQASAAAASRPLSEVTTYNGAEAQVRLGKAVSAPA